MSSTFIEARGSDELRMQKALDDYYNKDDEIIIDNSTAFDHEAVIQPL